MRRRASAQESRRNPERRQNLRRHAQGTKRSVRGAAQEGRSGTWRSKASCPARRNQKVDASDWRGCGSGCGLARLEPTNPREAPQQLLIHPTRQVCRVLMRGTRVFGLSCSTSGPLTNGHERQEQHQAGCPTVLCASSVYAMELPSPENGASPAQSDATTPVATHGEACIVFGFRVRVRVRVRVTL